MVHGSALLRLARAARRPAMTGPAHARIVEVVAPVPVGNRYVRVDPGRAGDGPWRR
ncbi:hypothetical protein [Blastococcus saxobsidens]|uniref:Uncharacterized protein n=1 Tax=Blastococcus saxobsidens TaxID=138336 RepID=A0A4V2G2U3_9ACTN|nr:hypothetical protein [Blastococcus saxobsidens]RZU34496.1 hypothetical protein BKA19_4266 [Blastococcus saxobsidens]